MEMSPETLRPAINRLKRARGQLNGIIDMMEQGRDCEEIVLQIAAVSKALERAGFAVVATGMRQCLADDTMDAERMEKLFLTLA